jgi:hypothetical protein
MSFQPYLYCLNGLARCRAFPLRDGTLTVGKDPGADIQLTDPWISWGHARLHVAPGRLEVEDLGSTNGSFLNLARVQKAELAGEDLLFFGGTHLLVVTSGRPPSPPPAALLREGSSHADGDRMRRLPGEIDVRPLRVDDAPDATARIDARTLGLDASSGGPGGLPEEAATVMLDLFSLDDDPIPELDSDAEIERDAFRAPPPRDEDLAVLQRVLARDPADATRRPTSLPGSIEIDIGDLVGDSTDDSEGRREARPGLDALFTESLSRGPAISVDDSAIGEPPPRGHTARRPVNWEPAAAVPGVPPEREVETLRALLASKEAEIRRLRQEILRLKERYLDMQGF